MEEKTDIKEIFIDWKQNAADAAWSLFAVYKYEFLRGSEIDELCKNISCYEPLKQLEYLGAYTSEHGYCLYQIDTGSDEYCLCLIKDTLEEKFLENTEVKPTKLYTNKKANERKIIDISDKKLYTIVPEKYSDSGDLSFCFAGEYIYSSELYPNNNGKCWLAKIDDGDFRVIKTDLKIWQIDYLEYRGKYVILLNEDKTIIPVLTSQLDVIDFSNIMEVPSTESHFNKFIDTPGGLYFLTKSDIFEMGDKITHIRRMGKSYTHYFDLHECGSDKLIIRYEDKLFLCSKKSKIIKLRVKELPMNNHSWGGYLSDGTCLYTVVNPSSKDFKVELVFYSIDRPGVFGKDGKRITLPHMESNQLYIDEDIIYIRRKDSYYGKFDDLQIYNYRSDELFRVKNGNFYAHIDQIHFYKNYVYFLIENTVYRIDKTDIFQYFEKVDYE